MTAVIHAVKGHPLYRGSLYLDGDASSAVAVAAAVAALSTTYTHIHTHPYLPTYLISCALVSS